MSLGNNTFGSKLTYDGLSGQYKYYYKTHYFPKLLQDGAVPENDKAFIRNMLTKPWNLYIFRHSALTEKSQILKEHVLRDHAGWTMTSKMPQVYIHYFGTESSRSLLEVRGIIKEKDHRVFQLRPKQCPNCNEPNKPDSKFCKHCRMVLSYDAYEETIQEQRQKDQKLERLEKTQLEMIEMLKIMVRNDNSPEALERRKKFETRAPYGKLFMVNI